MSIRAGARLGQPLIPDTDGITAIVREELASGDCSSLLSTIEEHFHEDRRPNVTVEDMLTHIRGLRAVAGMAQVRGLSADQLDKLDSSICDVIHDVVGKSLPDRETPYHHLASWIGAVIREHPVEIFTTNYDLLMEEALEDSRVPYFDGFPGIRHPFFDLRAMEEDSLPPRWARLWKLHGSINWYHVPNEGVFRGGTAQNPGSNRVIHPSHLKYAESRRMPYLAMIDRLRAFLQRPSATLVLCGYSFCRDDHINEIIAQGLQSTSSAITFALLYGGIAKFPQATELARRNGNLTVLARDGAIVSGRTATWSPTDTGSLPAGTTTGIEWAPPHTEHEALASTTTTFTLGDFAVLGQLLRELVGSARPPAKPSHAD